MSLRQRKDKLVEMIEHKKTESIESHIPENNKSESINSLFEMYSNILIKNGGIKNKKLITTQVNRLIALGLTKSQVYSNLKFILSLRSRLTEEGIPLNHAESIVTQATFNISGHQGPILPTEQEVNEDDDYITDVALRYAELVKLHYDRKVEPNTIELSDNLAKNINPMNVELPQI